MLAAFVAAVPPATRGSWALYSVLLVVVIVLIAFTLAAALLVMALLGRFRQAPPPAEETGEGDTPGRLEPLAEAAAAAPEEQEAATPPKRKTGLWQMLAAIGAGLVSPLAFTLVENLYGRMVTFSVGTAVQLLILAAQLVLSVAMVRLQRKL
jgi:hypothetical protein